MSASMVIGIHGLKNKPEKDLLARWWAMALQEGLLRNLGLAAPLAFELVYWADIQYPAPIPEAELDNPYLAADGQDPLLRYGGTALDTAKAIAGKWGGRAIAKGKDLIGLDEHVDHLLGLAFDDLRDYYGKPNVRDRVRDRLTHALHRHKNKRVCLIAHSMGSIIAYDVLRMLDQDPSEIEHFVTIGSPLGLPIVTQHARKEFSNTLVPQQVRRWTNLADPGDKIALTVAWATTIGLPLAASESRMTWSATITSTEQENATGTTPTAIYGLRSSRISFADFWVLEIGSSLAD